LPEPRSLTFRQYYGAFKSLSGFLAGITSLLPFLSKLLPENISSYVFPPLGSADAPARIGTVALALGTTYVAFFWRALFPRNNAKRVVVAIALAFVFQCLYLLAYLRFVRTIEVPTRGTAVSVSVGYARTEFAIQTFGGVSDWELLRQRGTSEEEIWGLWQARSLLVARGCLLLAYSGFVFCLVYGLSCGALYQADQSSH
jgi:hypothetical protein